MPVQEGMLQVQALRVLISFNFKDAALAEALRASLFTLDPDLQIALSPASYGAVYRRSTVANGIVETDAFLLLIGPSGIGPWQDVEYRFALERNLEDGGFAVIPVLAAASQVPQFSLPPNRTWIEAPVIVDPRILDRIIAALRGDTTG